MTKTAKTSALAEKKEIEEYLGSGVPGSVPAGYVVLLERREPALRLIRWRLREMVNVSYAIASKRTGFKYMAMTCNWPGDNGLPGEVYSVDMVMAELRPGR